jgi:type IV pilus assembly protein PilA
MRRDDGFTLIEVLVVVLVIGILVAIAIPSFLTQTTKAEDVRVKSELSTAQAAIESYSTEHDGKYTGATVADLRDAEPTLNDAASLAVDAATDGGYTLSLRSEAGSGTTFRLRRKDDGTMAHTCDAPGTGGCRAGGTW